MTEDYLYIGMHEDWLNLDYSLTPLMHNRKWSHTAAPRVSDPALTRARPGVWATFARPGGGTYVPPPANSKTTQRIDKRKKTLDRS